MHRRAFLVGAAGGASALGVVGISRWLHQPQLCQADRRAEVFGLVPVVGDGKWIWTKPPEGQKGYLEPRRFELSVGTELRGNGGATQIKATTAAPVALPEQKIDDVRIETRGCRAALRQVSAEAGQLMLVAPGIARGQIIAAVAHYKLTLYKDYRGFAKDQFPAKQPEHAKDFRKSYMYDSPGIQTRQKTVRELAAQVGGQMDHPWDKAPGLLRVGLEEHQAKDSILHERGHGNS